MKPVYQDILKGPYSNCLQASTASIFELELRDVPNFMTFDDEIWYEKFKEFCREHCGVYPMTFQATPEIKAALEGYHLIGVMTSRGVRHSVVGYHGRIIHDPFPAGSEITDIEDYTIFISRLIGL
jgi:hypothetical protein